jgi:hypothetical protein
MGIGMLYRLKREAEALASGGAEPTRPAHDEHPPEEAQSDLNELRALTNRVQELLAAMPSVKEIRISTSGAKMLRAVTREEEL